jgi:hypothetical protein
MATSKTVSHPAATTLQLAGKSSGIQSVTVTPTAVGERLWIGTDSRVSIYPWYGVSVTTGQSVTFHVPAGQTLYSYTNQPAQFTVSIA